MTNEGTQPQDVPSSETSPGSEIPQEQQPASPPPNDPESPDREPSSPPPATAESPTPPANPSVTQPAVNTPIPEGMDNPAAGSQAVNRWLVQTFSVTLSQCQEKYPEAKTLRQIVSALETTQGMTPPTATEAAETGDRLPDPPVPTDDGPSAGSVGQQVAVANHRHDPSDPAVHVQTHDAMAPHEHVPAGGDQSPTPGVALVYDAAEGGSQ